MTTIIYHNLQYIKIMKKKMFSELNPALLAIDDLYHLVKSTCKGAQVVTTLFYNHLIRLYKQMEAYNEKMGLQVNIPSRNDLADQLHEMNMAINLSFDEIKREIYSHLHHTDHLQKSAAKVLNRFMMPYWNSLRLNSTYHKEICREIISKYQLSPELMSSVSVLGIEILFSNLETMERYFDSLYSARIKEINEREMLGIALKPMVIKSYLEFCREVEEIVNFVTYPEIFTLFAQMDELRKKYSLKLMINVERQNEPSLRINGEVMEQLEIKLSS